MADLGTVWVDVKGNWATFKAQSAAEGGAMASSFAGFGAAAGTALVAGVGAVLAAGGIAVGLAMLGDQFDGAYDRIRVGTGKTGEALEQMKEDFRKVAAEVPASFDDIGIVITDLNQRLGLTGEPLQKLSEKFLDLSRITGTDVTENVKNITRLFGDWGITAADQSVAMDKVFRASQATGIGIDQLSISATKFGVPLRQLGFGFDETLALLGKFEKEGVNADLVMGSLRIALGKLARAGEDAPSTFRRLVGEIKAMPDATEATGKAIELFGAKAGPDMAGAIREGRFEVESLWKMVAQGGDTIETANADTEDFGEKWDQLKNRVFLALEPVATRVFELLGTGLDNLAPAFETFSGWIQTAGDALFGFNDAGEDTPGILEKIGGKFEDHFGPVMDTIKDVLGKVKELLSDIGEDVAQWFEDNEDTTKGWADALDRIDKKIGPLADKLARIAKINFTAAFEGLSVWWEQYGPAILNGIAFLVTTVLTSIDMALTGLNFFFGQIALIVEGKWGEAWNNATTIFRRFLDNVFAYLLELRGRIQAEMIGIAQEAPARMGEATGGMIRALIDSWPQILNFFETLPQRILERLGWAAVLLIGKGREVMAGLVMGLAAGINWVNDYFTGLADGIRARVGSWPSILWNAGVDMMRGLINGMAAMVGAIMDKVQGLANAIKDKITSAFRIGSPSRWFAEQGEFMLLGLSEGLENGRDSVLNDFGAINASISGTVDTGALAAATLPAGGGGVTVNARTDANAMDIAREVSWAMRTGGRV